MLLLQPHREVVLCVVRKVERRRVQVTLDQAEQVGLLGFSLELVGGRGRSRGAVALDRVQREVVRGIDGDLENARDLGSLRDDDQVVGCMEKRENVSSMRGRGTGDASSHLRSEMIPNTPNTLTSWSHRFGKMAPSGGSRSRGG